MSVEKISKKDRRIISWFFVFELLIVATIFVLTFVTDVRKTTLGRNISSRAEAERKGYGHYSDPEVGDCFTETGNCETPGSRFLIQRCVPNFSDGSKHGVGCVDKDGLITYDMIITEEGCNKQCYEDSISLQDNIQTVNRAGTLAITSVGTHQLLDKQTGIDMSDYFIDSFDTTTMKYGLKNCINDIKKYTGYKQKQYTCQPGTKGGVNGCIYSCGSDSTVTFSESVTSNNDQFLGSIPFPFYISGGKTETDGTITGGTKVFVCKDIQDNNSVEMLNHGKTIPKDFLFPEKCYNHINVSTPPDDNGGTLVIKESNTYGVYDRYIYISKDNSIFAPYFQPDYNYLNDLRTYVKIISNQEIMLLSRMYDGIGGLDTIYEDDKIIGYIPVSQNGYEIEKLKKSENISFLSKSENLKPVKNYIFFQDKANIIAQNEYYFVPILMLGNSGGGAFFQSEINREGTYIYDQPSNTLTMYTISPIGSGKSYYMFMKYRNNDYWIPKIFRVTTESGSQEQGSIIQLSLGNIPYSIPSTPSGLMDFKLIDYDNYEVQFDQFTKKTPIDLTNIIITGSMLVDNFDLVSANDYTEYVKFLEEEQEGVTFYIKGTPTGGSPSQYIDKLGFYYPLSLEKIDDEKSYQNFLFKEYPGKTFFLPTDVGIAGSKIMAGSLNSYDFESGVGTITIPTITTSITTYIEQGGKTYNFTNWTTPVISMKGRGYTSGNFNQIGDTDSYVYVNGIDNNDNTLLEVVRNGDSLFSEIETNLITEGQLRKSVESDKNTYQITIFPEKILQTERDFGNFLGPYTTDDNGKRNFVCTDSTGTPLQDGTIVSFSIGDTLTALVQDYNFNTNIPSECGTILLKNKNTCRQDRDTSEYNISKNCIVFNPEGDYLPVDDFLGEGYLMEPDNQLRCFVDGNLEDDSRCTKPFLTDYLDPTRDYAPGEELIVNNGDIKRYVSLTNNNNDLPSSDNWATYSDIQEISFNSGQYLGTKNTYITTKPGSIFMNMDFNIEPLDLLRYRTEDDYTNTKNNFWGSGKNPVFNYDQFRKYFNIVTPYLVSDTDNVPVSFFMTNNDISNPNIRVTVTSLNDQTQDKIFLEENYINVLLWYMSSVNFLDKKTSDLNNLEYINFVKLDEDKNNVDYLNSSSTLTLHNSKQKDDLTGYYCYFIPMLVSDNFTSNSSIALFGHQWSSYIYNLLNSQIANYPSKFEVVYVTGYQGGDISLVRNITYIQDQELLKFIPVPQNPPNQIDGMYGLLVPFSKSGPFPRLNVFNSDKKSFDLQFTMTPNYGLLTQHLAGGKLNVFSETKNSTFFGYGYSGFTIQDGYQSPHFDDGNNKLVQYNYTGSRTSCQSLIKHIRVTVDNKIFFSEVKSQGSSLVHRTGDIIVIETTDDKKIQFTVLGVNVSILGSITINNTTHPVYELFDYQIVPVNTDFATSYRQGTFFDGYIKYQNTDSEKGYIDYLLPSIYTDSSNKMSFILNISYQANFTQNQGIYLVTSDTGNSSAPKPVIQANSQEEISFLQDPSGTKFAGNENAGKFIRMVNSGKIAQATISVINIDNKSSILVDQIKGNPYGKLSFLDGITNDYNTSVMGKSFVTSFRSTNPSLGNNIRYEVDGYNFGLEVENLAFVDMVLKTHTAKVDYYRDFQKTAGYGDQVLFTDFRSKITYRNKTKTVSKFSTDKIYSDTWADNGKINPQVTYKLYHEQAIYIKGDIVVYNGFLWKAVEDIALAPSGGTSRQVPSVYNTDWSRINLEGDLYSGLNYFDTAISSISDVQNPQTIKLRVTSIQNTHVFPSAVFSKSNYAIEDSNYLFNTVYRFDLSGTPVIYLSSDGKLMDQKYNFTQNQYIMEIHYYLDSIEVTRKRYVSHQSLSDKVEISMLIRRSEKSILTPTLISQSNVINFGSDQTTSDGKLYFVNSNEGIVQKIQILNETDNQNIPIRIKDTSSNSLGYCFQGCTKNISDTYDSPSFGFIDLISPGLKDSFFSNILKAYTSSDSLISLSNEPCDTFTTVQDRYLSNCDGRGGDGTVFSQYLFGIPLLTRETYGVPFCGSTGPSTFDSFVYSNSVFFYLTPMDIDSQNFIKTTIKDNNIVNFNRYFRVNGTSNGGTLILTDNMIIKKNDQSYIAPDNSLSININQNQTTIINTSFTKDILTVGPIDITNGNNTIKFTPLVFDLSYQFRPSDQNVIDGISKFGNWWLVDKDNNPISYGFFFWPGATKPSTITESNMVKLSYVKNPAFFIDQPNLSIVVKGSNGKDASTSVKILGFSIEDYTLQPDGTISTTSQLVTYTGNGVKVSIYFDANSNIYQPGDYSYTTSSSSFAVGDNVYLKLFGDRCICKIYLNYGKYNALMSFQTDGTTVPTEDDEPTIPIIFNRSREGILNTKNQNINIISGNKVVKTKNFSSTFIIENGTIKPNPVQKPFNLSQNSEYYPSVIGLDLSVIVSGMSLNQVAAKFSGFNSSSMGNAIDYLNGVSGEQQNSYITNSELIDLSYRQNLARQNYEDSKYECNFIIPVTRYKPTQQEYTLILNSNNQVVTSTGLSSINARTNNQVTIDQSSIDEPLKLFVNGKEITEQNISYPNNQFLVTEYVLGRYKVDRDTFMDQASFESASKRYVYLTYQTEYDTNTSPGITKIDTNIGFTINLVENN